MAEGLPPPEVYLASGFNPNTLKVAQLRGLLLHHQIPHPSTSLKPALLSLFTTHVLQRRGELMDEVEERASVVASEEGIEVMGEGERMGGGKGKGTKGKAVDDHGEEEISPPPRRNARRSVSTTPAPGPSSTTRKPAGSKSRSAVIKVEQIEEEDRDNGLGSGSSPESEVEAGSSTTPVQPKSRAKTKSNSSAKPDRRTTLQPSNPEAGPVTPISAHFTNTRNGVEEPGSGSGFSDYNPFQSGGEESGGEKRRRRTVGGGGGRASLGGDATTPTQVPRTKSNLRNEARHSMPGLQSANPAAPPDYATDRIETPPKPTKSPIKGTPARSSPLGKSNGLTTSGREAQATYSGLPVTRTPPSLKKIVPDRAELRSPPRDWIEERQRELSGGEDEGGECDEMPTAEVMEMEAALEGGAPSLEVSPIKETTLSFWRIVRTMPFIATALLSIYFLREYRDLSREIGFCDTASITNSFTRQHQLRLQREADCLVSAKKAEEQGRPVPECDPVSWYHPTECTPCPEFGSCATGDFIECTEERVSSPHILSILNPWLNGMPRLGPVAFPATCERNLTQDNMILNYAMGIESYLAREKGRRICGESWLVDGAKRNEEDAIRYGVKEEELFQAFWDADRHGEAGIKRILRGALTDLAEHDDVIKQFGPGGKPFYAARRATIPFGCKVRMATVRQGVKHLKELIALVLVLATGIVLRSRLQSGREEKAKVKELVSIAMDRLQEQTSDHQLDPHTTPSAHLRPAQLRDLVLANTHDPAERQRLWTRVQGVIEGNANVKSGESEVDGDSWQVWEWIGPSRPDAVNRAKARTEQVRYPAF